jgi:hypothetical protein
MADGANAGGMTMDGTTDEKLYKLAKRKRRGLITALSSIACLVLLLVLPDAGGVWAFLAVTLIVLGAIALIVCGLLVWMSAGKKLREVISAEIVPGALNRAFELAEHNPGQHVPYELVDRSLIQSEWIYPRGSDYVRADYRGLPVEFSDLEFGDREESSSSDFDGFWLVCFLQNELPAEMLFIVRKDLRAFRKKLPEEMHPVSSGNAELDDKYEILTDNADGARAILSYAAISSVIRLYDHTDVKCNLRAKRDGKVYAAVNINRKTFAPGNPIEGTRQKITGEIRYKTDIIDMIHNAFINTRT